MNGVLNLDKPLGPSSFALVAEIRRRSGVRKVGHAGTLDPTAHGVLPICLGLATKIVPYIMEFPKTYEAILELGVTTDTYDAAGQVTERHDPSNIKQEDVERALPTFVGNIWQRPPAYSALKLRGKPLYALARAGIKVEPPPRPAVIYSLEIIQWQPPLLTIKMRCGRGTYVRSVAYELGQLLSCGAHVKETIRLAYGPFRLEDAVSFSQLQEAFDQGRWQALVHTIDKVLEHFPALTLNKSQAKLVLAGEGLPLSPGEKPQLGERRRCYNPEGRFFALIRFQGAGWQPERLFI